MRNLTIIPLIIILFIYQLEAQQECVQSTHYIVGADMGIERGYTLTPSSDGNGYYVGGFKNDSLTLLKADLSGSIDWSRSFDVSNGLASHVTRILLDSEGMIVLAGNHGGFPNGNSVFVIRYDPNADQILWSRRYSLTPELSHYSLLQKGVGGNYVISLSTVYTGTDDSNVIEINKNNGDLVEPFYVEFDLGASDGLAEIVYYEGFIYGTGRYTDGSSPADMRHTIAKLNENDGTQVWVKMGHRPKNQTARLYGADLTIYQDKIYSIYFGDPDGTSLTDNILYIQQTSLDGELLWLRSYTIPGVTGDAGVEIISSHGGLVVLAKERLASPRLVLFKVDTEGILLWSNAYMFTGIITNFADIENARSSQLIEVNNNLIFTGYGNNDAGGTNMVVVTTNLNGQVAEGCLENTPIQMTSAPVSNPVFYSVNPSMAILPPDVDEISVTAYHSQALLQCQSTDTVAKIFTLDKNICHNEVFEGYTISGTYTDTFQLNSGCDSIRILHLTVLGCVPIIHYDLNACVSYMHNGTNMDYSEFTPSYPELACAEVAAGILHRTNASENKHSCTPGVNNSDAMCVSSYASCTYTAGQEASVIIEFSVDPFEDSLFTFSKMDFYEKAPANYVWLDGPTGPNNYPLRYGIRILKNGVEIFRNESISTNFTWTLQSFDFIDNELFKVEGPTNFRIELLPYCPVGNGATVSAWDLDEIRIYSACAPLEFEVVLGKARSKDGRPINDAEIWMSEDPEFNEHEIYNTESTGNYLFTKAQPPVVFLRGNKKDDVLNGVSTIDIVYLQKHLLGISEFNSLTDYIAADVNNNQTLSAADMLEFRKLILGINTEFPRNKTWRFGPAKQDWQTHDISAFREDAEVYMLNDTHTIDFVGIKIGDLNGDVQLLGDPTPIKPRNQGNLNLMMEELEINKGSTASVDIKSGSIMDIIGMQCAFDLKNIEVNSIKPGLLNIRASNYHIEGNVLRMSWNDDEVVKLAENSVLFTMVVKAKSHIHSGKAFNLNPAILKAECYSPDLKISDILFNLQSGNVRTLDGQVFEIAPNPVHQEAKISFNLTKEGLVKLHFYDMSGRTVYVMEKYFSAGYHEELLAAHHLGGIKGMIYCQMISGTLSRVEKFLLVE